MNKPIISIIVAHGDNREIGNKNNLLWHISEDLKRFKMLTTGHPIIMGRKTFESIEKVLPNRTNIVITRNTKWEFPKVLVVNSLEKAINKARDIENKEIFIIGGGEIYKQALPYTDKLYITQVKGTFEADTFFPNYSEFKKIISESEWKKSGKFEYKCIELKK